MSKCIPDLIEADIGPIVDEWVEFARTRTPESHHFTHEELADHARVLLVAVAEDSRQVQAVGEKHAKAEGRHPGNSPEVTRVARDHAAQRFEQGFSFDHLVSEFRALRAGVIRRWTAQVESPGRAELEELTRFGEGMDQALAESASLYANKVEDSRNLLLGVLGHDLRTPLGVVGMSATYLLRADTLSGPQTKAAARILTSSQRMSAMVKDILDFTRTAFGVSLPVAPTPADMGALAGAIVIEVEALVPGCEVRLSTHGDMTGCWDGVRIGQMLANLIANAVQHGDKNEPVSVRITGDTSQLEIEVRNKGTPIPAQARKTLFLPLRQGESVGDHSVGSSGLGLASTSPARSRSRTAARSSSTPRPKARRSLSGCRARFTRRRRGRRGASRRKTAPRLTREPSNCLRDPARCCSAAQTGSPQQGSAMDSTRQTEIKTQLRSAESRVTRCRAVGSLEQYLEAFFLVESLERSLHQVRAEERAASSAR